MNTSAYLVQEHSDNSIITNLFSVFSFFRQRAGHIWAPDAVFGEFSNEDANNGMDITADGTCSNGYSWSGSYAWGGGHSWSCGYSWSGRYTWPGDCSWSGGTENSRWAEK